MGDTVFVNGLATVHKGSAGQAMGFPDVCLCPPTPPAGPIPTPLPNSVKAGDLDGGAPDVLIEGNPAGHAKSFLKTSTGNECARPTGGGIMTGIVQGMAYFQSFSMNVFFGGNAAVRHTDLVTMNHAGQPMGNTPPMPWMSTMSLPPVAPSGAVKSVGDDRDFIELRFVHEDDDPVAGVRFGIKTPDGRVLDGFLAPPAGVMRFTGLKKGTCKVTFPGLTQGSDKVLAPLDDGESAQPVNLDTGKTHRLVFERAFSFSR
jgi:Domain of unknown function (DUF4150)